MAYAFSLVRVRVTVDRQTLQRIADILGVPKVHRDRILRDGLVITVADRPASGESAARAATTGRKSRSTTARTTRGRK
jgi:hypothetical protein